jgi:hypothetical protein
MRHLLQTAALGTILVSGIGAGPTSPAATEPSDATRASSQRSDTLSQKEIEIAEKQRAQAEDRVQELRAAIRQETGLVDVTPDAIRQMIQKLQQQREQLALDAAGARGRKLGLEAAIARTSQQVEKRVESDAVVEQLQKVAAVRERQWERVKALHAEGTISSDAIAAAEVAMAEAQAQVATARQHAVGSGGANDALDGWNREMTNVSVEAAEREQRQNYIDSELQKFAQIVDKLDELDLAHDQARSADVALEKIRLDAQLLRAKYGPGWGGSAR